MMVLPSSGADPRVSRGIAIAHGDVLNWAAVLVWAVGFLDIVTGHGLPQVIPAATCVLFCLVVVPAVNRAGYFPILLALVGLVAFSLPQQSADPTWQGLVYGTRLGAFMFSILLLRQVLLDLAPLARARERFATMVPMDQKGAAVLLSGAFSSIFSFGTYALLGPLVRDHTAQERRAFGAVMLCGGTLTLMITPFSVGWFYATRLVPEANMALLVPVLAVVWGTGAVVAIALHGRLSVRAVWGAVASVAPLTLPLVLYGVVLAVTCHLTGLGVTEAITAATPLVYLLFYLVRRAVVGRPPLLTRMREAGTRAGRGLVEVLLYSSSLAFALAVIESGVVGHLLSDLLVAYPPRAVLVTMALVTPLVGAAGFHPSVPTALAVIIGQSILPADSAGTAILLLGLVWWAGASMLAFSSVSLWGACTEFDCTPRSVILGRNILVVVAVSVATALAIATGVV